MGFLEVLALGAIIMGTIYFLYTKWLEQKDKERKVILFEKDAERREKWAAEQAKMQSEMDARLKSYKQKKENYYKLKESLNNGNKQDHVKRDSNDTGLHNSTNVAPVYVLQPTSQRGDADNKE